MKIYGKNRNPYDCCTCLSCKAGAKTNDKRKAATYRKAARRMGKLEAKDRS